MALGSAQGGHTFPVQALVVVPPFLFSADWSGCIKVLPCSAAPAAVSTPTEHFWHGCMLRGRGGGGALHSVGDSGEQMKVVAGV